MLADAFAVHVPTGSLVLDAGCGTGATGAWLADSYQLVGIDSERTAVELFSGQRPGATLLNADISRLPLRDASVDAVLCVTVLCHRAIADPAATVGELVRVLKPGGVVCVLEPGVRRLRRAHDRAVHVVRRFAVGDMRTLLERNGCRVTRSSGAYSFLVPAAAAKAVVERGRVASDLEGQAGVVGAALGLAAAVERRWLRRRDLPAGLSVWAVGTKTS
ncbi:MAG TPA: class I SAM-dependent methyltransferase [Acidimicrobiales bacterium]|nr:class I SAM-dependent methyltransferase [Acidimicrobiales bacterium]